MTELNNVCEFNYEKTEREKKNYKEEKNMM